MKRVIAFIFFCNVCFGQITSNYAIENLHNLKKQKISWPKDLKTKTSKNSLVEVIYKDTLNFFCTEFDFLETGLLKYFHLLDIDGDKDVDILFEGLACEGDESKSVLIYFNENGIYKRAFYNHGRIVRFQPSKELIIYQYPCCAMMENNFITYAISKDTLKQISAFTFFHSFLLNNPTYTDVEDSKNILPAYLKTEGTFKLKENSKLYYVPKDSLGKYSHPKKNKFAVAGSAASVTVYARHTDEKGQEWLYCLVSNNAFIVNDKKLEFPILAWVKQKDSE